MRGLLPLDQLTPSAERLLLFEFTPTTLAPFVEELVGDVTTTEEVEMAFRPREGGWFGLKVGTEAVAFHRGGTSLQYQCFGA